MSSGKHDLRILVLCLGGLILAGLGLALPFKPLVGVGFLLGGSGMSLGMVETHRKGVLQTNWGTTKRTEDPTGFRLECAFWWTFVLAWTTGGVLHSLGILVK